MYTTKTTVLSDDPARAQTEFDRWVYHETVVMLVLLGRGTPVETTVTDADKMASKLDSLTHVLWAKNPEVLTDQISRLDGDPTLLQHLPGCRGFGLSLTDQVVDVICGDEPPPDLVRLLQVFTKALKRTGI